MKQTPWDATDTHEADTLGRNWYTWSRHLGTQLIHMKQTPWDATDTISWPRDELLLPPDIPPVWQGLDFSIRYCIHADFRTNLFFSPMYIPLPSLAVKWISRPTSDYGQCLEYTELNSNSLYVFMTRIGKLYPLPLFHSFLLRWSFLVSVNLCFVS